MNHKDSVTVAGAGVGVGFGPGLLQWAGELFVYVSGVESIPAMPDEVMVILGGALGGWLTRWYWSRQPIQREQFPRDETL